MDTHSQSLQPGFPQLQQDTPTVSTWHEIDKQGPVLLGVKVKWHKCTQGYVNVGYGSDPAITIAQVVKYGKNTALFSPALFLLNKAYYQVSNPVIEVEPIWTL